MDADQRHAITKMASKYQVKAETLERPRRTEIV